jgi:hypothetical protein
MFQRNAIALQAKYVDEIQNGGVERELLKVSERTIQYECERHLL